MELIRRIPLMLSAGWVLSSLMRPVCAARLFLKFQESTLDRVFLVKLLLLSGLTRGILLVLLVTSSSMVPRSTSCHTARKSMLAVKPLLLMLTLNRIKWFSDLNLLIVLLVVIAMVTLKPTMFPNAFPLALPSQTTTMSKLTPWSLTGPHQVQAQALPLVTPLRWDNKEASVAGLPSPPVNLVRPVLVALSPLQALFLVPTTNSSLRPSTPLVLLKVAHPTKCSSTRLLAQFPPCFPVLHLDAMPSLLTGTTATLAAMFSPTPATELSTFKVWIVALFRTLTGNQWAPVFQAARTPLLSAILVEIELLLVILTPSVWFQVLALTALVFNQTRLPYQSLLRPHLLWVFKILDALASFLTGVLVSALALVLGNFNTLLVDLAAQAHSPTFQQTLSSRQARTLTLSTKMLLLVRPTNSVWPQLVATAVAALFLTLSLPPFPFRPHQLSLPAPVVATAFTFSGIWVSARPPITTNSSTKITTADRGRMLMTSPHLEVSAAQARTLTLFQVWTAGLSQLVRLTLSKWYPLVHVAPPPPTSKLW